MLNAPKLLGGVDARDLILKLPQPEVSEYLHTFSFKPGPVA